MRIKIFGAGSIGNHMAYAFRTKGFEVHVCDNDIDALTRMEKSIYPGRYGKWDSKIKLYESSNAPIGGFDIIIIGTPPESHLDIAFSVLKENPRGLLIEKPLTYPFNDDLKKFHDLSKNVKTKIFIGYNHVVSSSIQKLNNLLKEKVIGDILSIDVNFRENWDGIFKAHPWLDGPKDSYLGFYNKGGGATCEHSHAINMWQHLSKMCNKGRISKVSSLLNFSEEDAINYDSIALVNVTTEKKLIGRIVQDVVTKPHEKIAKIIGNEGTIEWFCNFTPLMDKIILNRFNEEPQSIDFPKTRNDDFLQEINYLINELNNPGKYIDINLKNGYETMKVIEGIFQSHQNQEIINIGY